MQQHAQSDETVPHPAASGKSTSSHDEVISPSGADIADDDTSPGNRDDLYLSFIRAAIMREWQAQGGGDLPAGCEIAVDQVIGGKAIRAWTVNCKALPIRDRIRLETATMLAQLPYTGFESVFKAHIELAL